MVFQGVGREASDRVVSERGQRPTPRRTTHCTWLLPASAPASHCVWRRFQPGTRAVLRVLRRVTLGGCGWAAPHHRQGRAPSIRDKRNACCIVVSSMNWNKRCDCLFRYLTHALCVVLVGLLAPGTGDI